MRRVHELCFDTVQHVAVTPLVLWLARLEMLEVSFAVGLEIHAMVVATPDAEFHLVVCVLGGGVEDISRHCK